MKTRRPESPVLAPGREGLKQTLKIFLDVKPAETLALDVLGPRYTR